MRNFLFFSLLLISINDLRAHGDKHHGTADQSKKEKPQDISQEIKEGYSKAVAPIMQAKCFNCHSSQTNYPWYYKVPVVSRIMESHIKEARSHIDMTAGYPFKSHGTPKGDLKALIKVVEKDEMPPWYYTPFHEDSKLTKEEKATILKWARSSLKTLEK